MKYSEQHPTEEGFYWVTEDKGNKKGNIMLVYWRNMDKLRNAKFYHLGSGGYFVMEPSYWLPVEKPTLEQMRKTNV